MNDQALDFKNSFWLIAVDIYNISVAKRAIHLIDDSNITKYGARQSHYSAVADISLFHKYFHGLCALELFPMMP